MIVHTRPPRWFWAVGAALLLWGCSACVAFYMHMTFDPNDPANPAYDRQLYRSLPMWLDYVFAVAVGTVLLGATALLARSRLAIPLFFLSLVAVIVQFGWTLGATDLIAVKGPAQALTAPAVILGLGCVAAWFARLAERRGWIG